jgi:hypothetical protein
MLPLLSPAALSDPSSLRLTQLLAHGNIQCRGIYLGHFTTKKIYNVVLGADRIIQPPEITTFCSKLDLMFGQSCTFRSTAIINLIEPLSTVTCDLHPAVQFQNDRTHLRTSHAIVPYIADGAEVTRRVDSEHPQLVTQHALQMSVRHKHSTVGVCGRWNPEHSQCHLLLHKLQMDCTWTRTFTLRSRRLTA